MSLKPQVLQVAGWVGASPGGLCRRADLRPRLDLAGSGEGGPGAGRGIVAWGSKGVSASGEFGFCYDFPRPVCVIF